MTVRAFVAAATFLLFATVHGTAARATQVIDTTGWHASLGPTGTPITLAGASAAEFYYRQEIVAGSISVNVLYACDALIYAVCDTPNSAFVAPPGSADYQTSAGTGGYFFGIISASPGDYGLRFTANGIDYQGFATVDSTGSFISQIVYDLAPVPEPATWAMILLGFAFIGTTLRVRKSAEKIAFRRS